MKMINDNQPSRRSFFKTSALRALGTFSLPAFLGGCSSSSSKEDKLKDVVITEILDKAPDGRPLKAGLVGCGGRGTDAAFNLIEAGNDLQVTAICDIFKDKMETCRDALRAKGQNIPDEKCFVGFEAYKQVIDSGVDLVLLCQPPVFRPMSFEYAIQKGKHCFVEKPCAVDPVGSRKMLVLGKQAAQQNLSVQGGLCLRYMKSIVEAYRRVAEGAIGDIISVHSSRFGGPMWVRQREKGWNDMEYVMRNWVNFNWMCGDHIVDSHMHQMDLMAMFMGDKKLPVRAEATGGRQHAFTGDMYDFFSTEFVFADGLRAHFTNRKIAGCDSQNVLYIYGTKGYVEVMSSKIYNLDGTLQWEYPRPKRGDADQTWAVPNMYVQELIHFVKAIRTNTPINDMERHVNSNMMAILGREAAYSGKFITWDQIMASDLKLGPETWQFGPIPGFTEKAPVPGAPPKA